VSRHDLAEHSRDEREPDGQGWVVVCRRLHP
jgi:hypothetical protein